MATIKPNISTIVARQLPEFIRDEYPSFVSFVEAYYAYLDANYNGRNIEDYRNLDETVDSFIQQFKNELNVLAEQSFPNYANLNEKETIIRKAKQYFSAKGSEAAYKFLFRALYGKEIEVYYPSEAMLRASDGKWQQDLSFYVSVTSGDALSIVGKEVNVYNSDGLLITTTFVERVILVSSGIYEVFVQRYYGSVSIGDTLRYSTTFVGTLLGTIVRSEILNAGANFTVGQIFDIDSSEGSGAKIKITQVSSLGAIQKYKIIAFGYGYVNNFTINLNPTLTSFVDPSPISVSLNSVEQFNVPSSTYTTGISESGFIINPDYWDLDYSDPAFAGTALGGFTDSYTFSSDTDNVATLKFYTGALNTYPGYYSKNDGFVSDAIFIQDSRYYQAYSYEIRIDELLSSYRDLIKSYIHPTGTALFGNYKITNVIDLGTTLSPTTLQIRYYLSDGASITESPALEVSKVFADAANISESSSYHLNKENTETVSTTESGAVYLNPYAGEDFFAEDYALNNIAASTF